MDDNLLLPDSQPNRADALRNRALLLETAQRLFDAQGVDAVSMTAIAEAAGVGKGTLYRHFENKTDLCHALLDQDMRDLQERALRRLRGSTDPRADLEWFVEQIARFVLNNVHLLHISEGGNVSLLTHPAHLWWRQTIRGLLGRIAPAGDPDYLADTLYIMLDIHTLHFQRSVQGYDLNRILDGLRHILRQLTLQTD